MCFEWCQRSEQNPVKQACFLLEITSTFLLCILLLFSAFYCLLVRLTSCKWGCPKWHCRSCHILLCVSLARLCLGPLTECEKEYLVWILCVLILKMTCHSQLISITAIGDSQNGCHWQKLVSKFLIWWWLVSQCTIKMTEYRGGLSHESCFSCLLQILTGMKTLLTLILQYMSASWRDSVFL